MTVVARLKVNHIKPNETDTNRTVYLDAVYSEDHNSPNYSFSQATPSAQLIMQINNLDAYRQFHVGDTFDLIFNRVGN